MSDARKGCVQVLRKPSMAPTRRTPPVRTVPKSGTSRPSAPLDVLPRPAVLLLSVDGQRRPGRRIVADIGEVEAVDVGLAERSPFDLAAALGEFDAVDREPVDIAAGRRPDGASPGSRGDSETPMSGRAILSPRLQALGLGGDRHRVRRPPEHALPRRVRPGLRRSRSRDAAKARSSCCRSGCAARPRSCRSWRPKAVACAPTMMWSAPRFRSLNRSLCGWSPRAPGYAAPGCSPRSAGRPAASRSPAPTRFPSAGRSGGARPRRLSHMVRSSRKALIASVKRGSSTAISSSPRIGRHGRAQERGSRPDRECRD